MSGSATVDGDLRELQTAYGSSQAMVKTEKEDTLWSLIFCSNRVGYATRLYACILESSGSY